MPSRRAVAPEGVAATDAPRPAAALVTAAHPGPAAVVTTIAALLTAAAGASPATTAVMAGAVLAGQLTVGWVNDLLDRDRDRASGRTDKPLASGAVPTSTVVLALGAAGAATVGLSLIAGWRAALVHLLLFVAPAQAYNVGLKATPLSWLPYAVAFGALPSVATLAAGAGAASWWATLAGAALGVGAHLANALPDLADDLRAGVRGLPHRLGERATRWAAAGVLTAASALVVLGPAGSPPAWAWPVLAVVAALAVTAATGSGRGPFRAAMAIALVDVVLLVVTV